MYLSKMHAYRKKGLWSESAEVSIASLSIFKYWRHVTSFARMVGVVFQFKSAALLLYTLHRVLAHNHIQD